MRNCLCWKILFLWTLYIISSEWVMKKNCITLLVDMSPKWTTQWTPYLRCLFFWGGIIRCLCFVVWRVFHQGVPLYSCSGQNSDSEYCDCQKHYGVYTLQCVYCMLHWYKMTACSCVHVSDAFVFTARMADTKWQQVHQPCVHISDDVAFIACMTDTKWQHVHVSIFQMPLWSLHAF